MPYGACWLCGRHRHSRCWPRSRHTSGELRECSIQSAISAAATERTQRRVAERCSAGIANTCNVGCGCAVRGTQATENTRHVSAYGRGWPDQMTFPTAANSVATSDDDIGHEHPRGNVGLSLAELRRTSAYCP